MPIINKNSKDYVSDGLEEYTTQYLVKLFDVFHIENSMWMSSYK